MRSRVPVDAAFDISDRFYVRQRVDERERERRRGKRKKRNKVPFQPKLPVAALAQFNGLLSEKPIIV